jgi:hypothetical protein
MAFNSWSSKSGHIYIKTFKCLFPRQKINIRVQMLLNGHTLRLAYLWNHCQKDHAIENTHDLGRDRRTIYQCSLRIQSNELRGPVDITY